jgi:hypothetical protein
MGNHASLPDLRGIVVAAVLTIALGRQPIPRRWPPSYARILAWLPWARSFTVYHICPACRLRVDFGGTGDHRRRGNSEPVKIPGSISS